LKPGTTVSRGAWTALAFAGLAFAAGLGARQYWRLPTFPADAELHALEQERTQLGHNSDELRSTLLRQASAVRSRAWSDEGLARLQQELTGWTWTWDPPGRRSRVVLTLSGSGLEAWSRYVDAVRLLAAKPGAILESADAVATGDARNRRFVRLTIAAHFVRADAVPGDDERAAPGRGPLPAAPAHEPAGPRKIGPDISPSLMPARPSGDPAGLHPSILTQNRTRP
jgi:hypothetical protein